MENYKVLNCIKGINKDSDDVAMVAAVISVVSEYFNEVNRGVRVYNTQDDRDARILLDKYGAMNLYSFVRESNNGFVIAGGDVRPKDVYAITPFNYATTIKIYFPIIEKRLETLCEHGHSLEFIQQLYYDLDIKKFFYGENEYQLRKCYIGTKDNSSESDEYYYFKTKKEAVKYADEVIKRDIGWLDDYLLDVSSPTDDTSALYELTNRKDNVKMVLQITKIIF